MKLSTILEDVELRRIALPEFQRGYVWTREDVRRLFESLYQGYPVGGLLTWTTESHRTATRGTVSGPVVQLLLDGQQRVTSLFGVIRGSAPEFFTGNAQAFTGLYFNVRDEVFEFYGPIKMRNDPAWVSVTAVFTEPLENLFARAQSLSTDPAEQAPFGARLSRLRSINDREFHIEQITGRDRSIEEVVDIFNRVNSGGTKLSAGDLALARICAEWSDARSEMQAALDGWTERGYGFKKDWLLRCVTSVATGQASFSSLRAIDVTEFADALQQTIRAIDYLLDLVADHLGLDHERVLAGPYAFTALVRLVCDRGGAFTDGLELQRVLYWYVHSFIWGRYSGSTETVLQRDLDALAAGGSDGLLGELRRWRSSLEVRPEDFDASSRGSRFYPLLYLLTKTSATRDFYTGLTLRESVESHGVSLYLHHIFPKADLKSEGVGSGAINALANFCFLTVGSVSGAPPEVYMPLVETKHSGALASQWVPIDPALWEISAYEPFLAERRRSLAEAANDFLNSLLHGRAAIDEIPRNDGDGTSVEPTGAIARIVALADRLGLVTPAVDMEIVDENSGEMLAMADIAWSDSPLGGGRAQPVAFLLERNKLMESRLGELGYQFFTDEGRLAQHLELLLGADIDGDGPGGKAPTAEGP